MKTMRPLLIAVLAILVVVCAPGGLQAGHSSGSSYNVTTRVYDTDALGAATLMQSDNYNGSGQATYTTTGCSNNGTCSLWSNLYNGVLYLDLYNQSLRTLYITPNDPYAPAQNPPVPIPPPGYYSQYVEMVVHCYDQSFNVVPLQNITTSSGNCQLGVDFGYGGVKYKLILGPSLPAPGPATGLVMVNCNATSGGLCVNWTITPNPNGSLANVANLYYWSSQPHGKLTYIGGQYYNTFRINVTNP